MRFQDRDGLILHAIQDYGGVIAKRQIHDLFWMGKSERVMQNRLSKLYANKYINRPSLKQRKLNPIPEPIIWLDWKGVLYLANIANLKVDPPKTINENQLRSLELSLRRKGLRWLREPRWTQLHHDLTVIDIRLKIGFDLQALKYLEMEHWINETDFRSNLIGLPSHTKTEKDDCCIKNGESSRMGISACMIGRERPKGSQQRPISS